MPMSVTRPVTWVVRISDLDTLVMTAFCKPIMKHSSITVTGTNRLRTSDSQAPSRPKTSSKAASSNRGKANSLWSWRRLAQLTRIADTAAPERNDSNAPKAAMAVRMSPNTSESAIDDTMPVMCEVYCRTARNAPALVAPAMKAKAQPNWRLPAAVLDLPVKRRA